VVFIYNIERFTHTYVVGIFWSWPTSEFPRNFRIFWFKIRPKFQHACIWLYNGMKTYMYIRWYFDHIYIYTHIWWYIYIYTRILDPNRIKYETMKTCVDLVYPIVAKSCIVFILSTRKTQPTKHWATARPFFEVGCVAWVGCVLAGSSTTWVVALSMSAATTGPGGMFPMDSCRTQPGFFQPTRHVWDRKNMVS
jgi:hypothetical protein